MCAGARPSRLIPRARRDIDVWFLNGAIVLAAVVLFVVEVQHYEPISSPHIPWWGLAIMFAVGERCVVHVHFRRSAHSFSFGDVPLVFGLVFSSGPDLILAGLVGAAVPLIIDRQLPLVKTVFNLGQFALGACLGEVILHSLTSATDVVHPSVWIGVMCAVEASALLSVALIGAAIGLSEGRLPAGVLREMAMRDFAVTVTNTSIALAAAIIIGIDARALPLIIIPAATVFLAYRAYTAERARHERLEFLYEATRTLAKSPEIILALEGLLTRSLEAFRAEMAEVILVSDNEGQPPLRTYVDHTSRKEAMTPIDPDVAAELIELVKSDGPVITVAAPFGSPRVREYMAEHGVTHAMIALLRDEERIVGTLMLANRPGVVRDFGGEDLKLFEALANNTSVALQFDRLEQSIWQMRELQEQLQHQAFHDPLTDLANRSLFNNQVRDALSRAEGSIAVLFVDVDDFKTVNDTLGHAVGDELLTRIADRLRACILPTDVVARLGGDEFAVLVQHVEDPRDAARAVAERILTAFDMPAAAGPRQLKVRLTIGIATGVPGVDHADEIIRNADIAMYHAKRAGKNSWKIFEPSMRAAVLARHGLHTELEQAIARNEFRVDYQPIFQLDNNLMYSTEALVRWTRPGQGPVLPSSFIPVAEETGLIKAVGQAVLQKACRDAASWLESGDVHEDFAVQVNLSAVELEDPELVTRVDAVLAESGLPARHLVLELTESAVLRDAVQGTRALNELKALGVGLALDDFGTGYSSLSYLRTLPFDMLKIARPFVEGAARHPQEASFVKMMLELGRTLGMKVVAEGIETTPQLDFVRGLECDLGQGFLLGRPDRPGEIKRLLDLNETVTRSTRVARVA